MLLKTFIHCTKNELNLLAVNYPQVILYFHVFISTVFPNSLENSHKQNFFASNIDVVYFFMNTFDSLIVVGCYIRHC